MGHLKDIGETYWQHLKFAMSLAFLLFKAGFAVLVHAVVPSLFVTTASNTIKEINFILESRKDTPEDENDSSKWFV